MAHALNDAISDLGNNPFIQFERFVEDLELDIAHGVNSLASVGTNVKDVSGVKRKFNGDVVPKAQSNLPSTSQATPIHRSISTGERNMSRKGNDGHEVEVVPPPKKIAKTIPDYTTIKLGYYERVASGSVVAPALMNYVFRLNSIFDPDVTAAGHQPLGRDHWAGVYKYYRVLAADVKLHWYNATDVTAAVRTIPQLVGYELTDDVTDIYSDWQAWVEGKHSKVDLLLNNSNEFEGSGGKVAVQSLHYTPESWDVHVHEAGVTERWTPVGENSPNQHYLALHMTPAAATGATYEAVCMVYISYTVQFRELQQSKKKTADS